jgi:hypothetical protein
MKELAMESQSAEWRLFAGAACQAGGVPAPYDEVPAIRGIPEKKMRETP